MKEALNDLLMALLFVVTLPFLVLLMLFFIFPKVIIEMIKERNKKQ